MDAESEVSFGWLTGSFGDWSFIKASLDNNNKRESLLGTWRTTFSSFEKTFQDNDLSGWKYQKFFGWSVS